MPDLHLVADSTCDVTREYAAAHRLTIVPLTVIIGEEVHADHVELEPSALYARMRSEPISPRTSQPAPQEFEAVFRRLGEDGAPIVCTTISAAMSGTHAAAAAAREALPHLDIRVVDTRTAGLGHWAAVDAAVRAVEAGAGPAEVEEVLARVRETQRLVFTVDTLEYLRRGGRIGGARALLGSVLNIKPVLQVRDGTVQPLDRVRTYARALDRLLAELRSAVAHWGGARVVVSHADRLADAQEVARRAAEIAGEPVSLIEVGPVIGCHGGPGAIGIAFHRPI